MNLMDIFKQYLGGGGSPGIVRDTANAITYGPAVSRWSRTPIAWSTNLEQSNYTGQYDPTSKTITVNPMALADIGNVIRHESIHALMDQLPQHGQAVATQAAGYPALASVLGKQVAGSMPNEVPAYMGSYPHSQFLGVTDAQQQAYLNSLYKLLPNNLSSVIQSMQRQVGGTPALTGSAAPSTNVYAQR